jgi:hypothetical protein
VQKRIKNIRTAYVKWKKIEKQHQQVPSGSSASKRPKLYKYSSELAFLEPVTVSSPTLDNMSQVRHFSIQIVNGVCIKKQIM